MNRETSGQLKGLPQQEQQQTLLDEQQNLQLQQHLAAAVAANVLALPVSYERRSIRSLVRVSNISSPHQT